MKWQKNTGVMPCEGLQSVRVRLDDGEFQTDQADFYEWDIDRSTGVVITHYCILDVPPFDYVEPKVWTVELSEPSDAHFNQHGEFRFTIINDTYRMWQEVLAALNAWEERNATE